MKASFYKILFSGALAYFYVVSESLSDTTSFNTPAVADSYTVPAGVTRITIEAKGADGGLTTGSSNGPGSGANVTAVFNVLPGDLIEFVVGEAGATGDLEAGGGAGTGVFINGNLVMVSGGGGGSDNTGIGDGGNSGVDGTSPAGNGAPGINGQGGGAGGGNVGDGGAGGGGILSAGEDQPSAGGSLTTGGGQADTNTADGLTVSAGGTSNQTTDPAGSDGMGSSGGSGFGGGGAGSHRESGAGGGYSGGGGGTSGGRPGAGGSFLDTAYAGYVSGGITAGVNGGGDGSSGFVTISFDASFIVTKTQTSGANPVTAAGQVLNYQISVENTGDTPLSGVSINDTLPNGSTITPAFQSGDTNSDGAIDTDETFIYSASYTVTQADIDNGGNLVNEAFVTTTTTGPNAVTDTAITPINQNPLITVTKLAAPSVNLSAGTDVTYTYDVRNDGNVTLSNITLDDVHNGFGAPPVPGNEAILTDVSPFGDSTDAGINASWDSLAPGDTVRFNATYSVVQQDIDLLQ